MLNRTEFSESGNFGTSYTDYGHGTFPLGNRPYGLPDPRQDCTTSCTEEMLQKVGYKRPIFPYPQHTIDPSPQNITRPGEPIRYNANITIRCLEPPLQPSLNVSFI